MKNLLKISIITVYSILFLFVSLSAQKSYSEKAITKTFNIVDYGATGDGATLNTITIQKTIDEASAAGGGIVVIPQGKFVSGCLLLKQGVILNLLQNAVLLGSTNPYDYIIDNRLLHFINAENVSDIGITGLGTIDGRGRFLALNIDSLFFAGKWEDPGYNYRRHRPERRPKLLNFSNCKNVILDGFTARRSASWVLNFDRCVNMTIHRVTVDSDDYWNNDGMDIGDCRNVRITECYVNSSDDGICLKSHHTDSFNDSIYVANCTVRSSASAIKFGTASLGGFKNIKIENIYIFDTFRSAIALESVDGGILENIEISDITASNTGNAIFIKLGHRNVDGKIGSLKNVKIKNLVVQVPFGAPDSKYDIRGPELAFFHNPFPASITGLPDNYVENISLENIRIIYPGRANNGYAHLPLHRLSDVPENESEYPEFSMFGELPSWGFYVRHVKGLSMKDINLKVEETDFRPAFVFDDVKNLDMKQIHVDDLKKGQQVVFRNVSNFKSDFSDDRVKVVK